MHIAVLGASGRTGAHVVTQGLERGHTITALNRTAASGGERNARLARRSVDVRDSDALAEGLGGADAVISALGTDDRGPTDLYSRGAANTVAGAPHARLVFVSAAPAGPRQEQPWLLRRVMMPMLDRFLGDGYADMRRMEAGLASGGADWVVVRPPRLLARPARGRYRLEPGPVPGGRSITHADLAAALLDLAEGDQRSRTALFIAN